MTAFVANTNILEIDGISSATDGTFLNSATVTVTVSLTGGANVAGITWPQTMAYVAGSNGNYRLTLPSGVSFVAGQSYTAAITVNAGVQGTASYSFAFTAQTRATTPATSGSFTFQLANGEIMLQAFRRIGKMRTEIDQSMILDARMEMNSMFSSWSNKGPNLWTVDHITLTLAAGVSTYAIDPATIDLLDGYITVAGNDRVITSISGDEYDSYPNKTAPGVPSVFWFNRLIAPTVTFYLTPDSNGPYTVTFRRFRQSQDANPQSGQTPEIPYRWIDATVWGLAERLAFIYAPDRLQVVGPKAAQAYAEAAAEDTEDAPLRLMPDMSGFFR